MTFQTREQLDTLLEPFSILQITEQDEGWAGCQRPEALARLPRDRQEGLTRRVATAEHWRRRVSGPDAASCGSAECAFGYERSMCG